ncbi:MAG TPA: recombinase family protein [Firmicutes bacterium]|nr:recombinase family protein [Bacillota bacterium]
MTVYKLDRFSRDKYESTIHKHTLKENGVKLVSAMENIPDSPEGIILESLLEGMNQYYSAELSQKVLRGMRESYLKGNYTGGILLYGFDVINEQEGAIVKEIFTKFAQGYTAVDIAADLKARGIRTKKGEYLIDKKIYRMLGNTKYIGKIKHGDTVYTNIYPKLIDDETWQAVQKIRNINKHLPGQKKDIFDFILSGKLICGDCKQTMVGISGTSKTGATYYYYTCLSRSRRKRPCGLHAVGKQCLEDTVINTTWRFLSDKETVRKIAETLYRMHEQTSRESSILKSLENQRSAALKATQNLISAIEQGFLTEQTKVRLKELETQISQLDFDIEQEKQRSYTYLTPQMIEDFLNSVICGDIENMEIRKAIVKVFIREIILYNDKIVITYNFCDTFSKHTITQTDIKAIEKQLETAAFSYPLGSNKLSSPAPYENNTNSFSEFVLFFVRKFFEMRTRLK